MTRPLIGQREVFRRLEERNEGRARRQWEQQNMLGIEQEEGVDSLTPQRFQGYADTIRSMQQSIRDFPTVGHGRTSMPRGTSIWIDEYAYHPQTYRYPIETNAETGLNNPCGLFIGEIMQRRVSIRQTVEAIVRMANGKTRNIEVPFHEYQWKMAEYLLKKKSYNYWENMWSHRNIYRIEDLFVGGMQYHPFTGRIIASPVINRESKEIVFGSKVAYVHKFMDWKLDEFLGLTKIESKIKRMRKVKNKSLAFLLRKEKI